MKTIYVTVTKFSIIFTCPGHNMVKIWIFMHKIFSNMLTDEWKISRRVGMNWNFKGRRKEGKRREGWRHAINIWRALTHEARVNKLRQTIVDPRQQLCAVSNVSSVCYQLLPWLYLFVSTCTEIHHDVQLNWLPLGRGQRGRSLREDVVDNGGDQPILQDETGLTSGTSNERKQPKKFSKTLKKCNRPFVINI